MEIYPPEKCHFRGFRTKVRGKILYHPAYIIGEDGDRYLAVVITHSPTSGSNHPNHRLEKNPNHNDPRPSYMVKKIILRSKKCFRKGKMKDLSLSKKDRQFVRYLISKRGKRL